MGTNLIMQEDDAISEGTQSSGPTKCHVMGSGQTPCIQPGFIAMRFSNVRTIKKDP